MARRRSRFRAERLDGLEDHAQPGPPCRFPPEQVAEVEAIACELPKSHELPLSRFSRVAHLMDFGQHYRTLARPFQWTFTRAKLDAMIEKITRRQPDPLALAA